MKKVIYSLSMVLVMVFIILFSVFTVVNTDSFYSEQYVKNGADRDTGVSFEDLDKITAMLLDYLNDKRDDLDMQVEKYGEMKQVFDQRETTHMVDVKNLYSFFAKVMYISIAAAVIMLGFMYKKEGRQGFFTGILGGYKVSLLIGAILIVIFAYIFTVGFNDFWTLFHEVMFTNDLWLLDPRISTMINMFPLPFWLAMCTDILVRFGVLFFALFPVLNVLKKQFSK